MYYFLLHPGKGYVRVDDPRNVTKFEFKADGTSEWQEVSAAQSGNDFPDQLNADVNLLNYFKSTPVFFIRPDATRARLVPFVLLATDEQIKFSWQENEDPTLIKLTQTIEIRVEKLLRQYIAQTSVDDLAMFPGVVVEAEEEEEVEEEVVEEEEEEAVEEEEEEVVEEEEEEVVEEEEEEVVEEEEEEVVEEEEEEVVEVVEFKCPAAPGQYHLFRQPGAANTALYAAPLTGIEKLAELALRYAFEVNRRLHGGSVKHDKIYAALVRLQTTLREMDANTRARLLENDISLSMLQGRSIPENIDWALSHGGDRGCITLHEACKEPRNPSISKKKGFVPRGYAKLQAELYTCAAQKVIDFLEAEIDRLEKTIPLIGINRYRNVNTKVANYRDQLQALTALRQDTHEQFIALTDEQLIRSSWRQFDSVAANHYTLFQAVAEKRVGRANWRASGAKKLFDLLDVQGQRREQLQNALVADAEVRFARTK